MLTDCLCVIQASAATTEVRQLLDEVEQLQEENDRLVNRLSRAGHVASARDAAEQTITLLQVENKRYKNGVG